MPSPPPTRRRGRPFIGGGGRWHGRVPRGGGPGRVLGNVPDACGGRPGRRGLGCRGRGGEQLGRLTTGGRRGAVGRRERGRQRWRLVEGRNRLRTWESGVGRQKRCLRHRSRGRHGAGLRPGHRLRGHDLLRHSSCGKPAGCLLVLPRVERRRHRRCMVLSRELVGLWGVEGDAGQDRHSQGTSTGCGVLGARHAVPPMSRLPSHRPPAAANGVIWAARPGSTWRPLSRKGVTAVS